MRTSRVFPLYLSLLCLMFAGLGLALMPYIGVHNDEALFGAGIYPPKQMAWLTEGGMPMMLMSYVGALKSWIYQPVFLFFAPSAYSVRIPVLLIGALTLLLFGRWTWRAFGPGVAFLGVTLLATNATYLVTTVFDWGPVVLQRFLFLAMVVSVWQFHRTGRSVWMLAGGLAAGLALWDKALFLWIFSGAAMAGLIVFFAQVRQHVFSRAAALFLAGLLAGAAPLVAFNLKYDWVTLRGNTRFSSDDLPRKLRVAQGTLEGGAVLGYIVRDQPNGRPILPETRLEEISVALNEATGGPRAGYFLVAFLSALLLAPLLAWGEQTRQRLGKPALWALLTMAIAYPQMLFNENTGTGTHHVALLWPLPQLFVALVWVGAIARWGRPGRAIAAALALFVGASSLTMTNQYLAQAIQYGSGPVWTDAIRPLTVSLLREPPKAVGVLDWGIHDSLRLMGGGKIPTEVAYESLLQEDPAPEFLHTFRRLVATPGAVFLTHVPDHEVFTGVREKFFARVREAGLEPAPQRQVADRAGRPIFELWRIVRRQPELSAP